MITVRVECHGAGDYVRIYRHGSSEFLCAYTCCSITAATSLADIRNSSTPTPSAVAASECAPVVSGTKRSTRTVEPSRSKGEGRSECR